MRPQDATHPQISWQTLPRAERSKTYRFLVTMLRKVPRATGVKQGVVQRKKNEKRSRWAQAGPNKKHKKFFIPNMSCDIRRERTCPWMDALEGVIIKARTTPWPASGFDTAIPSRTQNDNVFINWSPFIFRFKSNHIQQFAFWYVKIF